MELSRESKRVLVRVLSTMVVMDMLKLDEFLRILGSVRECESDVWSCERSFSQVLMDCMKLF